MTKKHFIALADAIKAHNSNRTNGLLQDGAVFDEVQINLLAGFCQSQNPRFNRSRWLDYIAGKCGPNGGAIKGAK